MRKAFGLINYLKYRIELAIAFGAGTVVGFSAGVGMRLLKELSDESSQNTDSGISMKRAEKLKDNLETEVSIPN